MNRTLLNICILLILVFFIFNLTFFCVFANPKKTINKDTSITTAEFISMSVVSLNPHFMLKRIDAEYYPGYDTLLIAENKIPHSSKSVSLPRKIVNPYAPYTYEQMKIDINKLILMYPDLISQELIGKSVEGRDLLSIKIGYGNKKILFIGSHHAREYISTTLLMKMIDEYAYSYSTDENFGDYNIKHLLDNVSIYIVPMLNPDGVNLVQNGIDSVSSPYKEQVKSMRMLQKTYLEWKSNIRGVDLNRQYPAAWCEAKSNTNVPSSEMYKGVTPATEPEIQSIMEYTRNLDFVMAMSFHSKGEIIYWHDLSVTSYQNKVEPIVDRLVQLTGYKKGPYRKNPTIYGAGYENWFRQEFKRPSFCIELTPHNKSNRPHNDKNFDFLVWDKCKYIGTFFLQEAINY